MREELDQKLCEKYPKIFRDRYADMQTTAMCWGFECGDGWYNILDTACRLIQNHIDWARKQRALNLRFNRALKTAIAGDKSSLIKYHSHNGNVTAYSLVRVEEDIINQLYRNVPDKVSQVIATQVKEKFGTLRFYTNGGDEYCHGVISMAEAMSGLTCETCGKPGNTVGLGWLRTLCDDHARVIDNNDN